MAAALAELESSEAKEASIERQIRRFENDTSITATSCFHPFAQHYFLLGKPKVLLLVIDPTTQEERVVMLMISLWYRGTALPLVWTMWPGNQPLVGERFWERVSALLDQLACLLPVAVAVTILADRAFGTPAFTDLVVAHGWHYRVRLQGQTRYQEWHGQERECSTLVTAPSAR